MFLIDKEGIIIGRGLDSDALERLLDIVLPGFVDYEYGSAASAALMDELFASYDDTDRVPWHTEQRLRPYNGEGSG